MAPGDSLLLGTDRVKDPARLVAAARVTAEFDKNVLTVLNRELGADFDVDRFDHVARWDADEEWIEVRLRSRGAQDVKVPALGIVIRFADGEDLRTWISATFRPELCTVSCSPPGCYPCAGDGPGWRLRPVPLRAVSVMNAADY
jgi:L-histidine N-alpha-methyltransferase